MHSQQPKLNTRIYERTPLVCTSRGFIFLQHEKKVEMIELLLTVISIT